MRYLLILTVWALSAGQSVQAFAQDRRVAFLLEIEGAIGPATVDYMHRALAEAADAQADLVILRLDTPGGLSTSMRSIIQDILASPVPVAGFVYPSGARAASAGTYILYACHIAAMAPATHLGAATPVQVGPGGGAPTAQDEPDAMTRKAVNDAVAYIRGLARLRGRNAEWAEKAVREAATLDAEDAVAMDVVDLVAADPQVLLRDLEGWKVTVDQQTRVLNTSDMVLRAIKPDWRNRLLSVITDPNVAYILMLIGIYGLIFEFANPGMILPGVVGAICLVLALYAFQVLPINYAGLGLILLGIALMVAEAFAPSFGVLGIGGVLAFVIGSIIMMDTDTPGFGISLALIAAVAVASAALFVLLLGFVLRARTRPVVSGSEELIGARAVALEDIEQTGRVRVHGEIWRARSAQRISKGQTVRVTNRDGLTLTVTAERKNGG